MKEPYLLYFDNLLYAIIRKENLDDVLKDGERTILMSSNYQDVNSKDIYLCKGSKKNIIAKFINNKFKIL